MTTPSIDRARQPRRATPRTPLHLLAATALVVLAAAGPAQAGGIAPTLASAAVVALEMPAVSAEAVSPQDGQTKRVPSCRRLCY